MNSGQESLLRGLYWNGKVRGPPSVVARELPEPSVTFPASTSEKIAIPTNLTLRSKLDL